MHICIYTKDEFYQADKEHILQNFFGARWRSNSICCNKVQSIFGRTIDCALEEGLKVIRNLFGTEGGRGGEGPDLKNVEDKKGNKYHLKPGGVPCIAEPIIQKSSAKNGTHLVRVSLRDIKQFGWTTAKLREQFPEVMFDINEIKNNLSYDEEYLKEEIHLRFRIGGTEYFRSLLKSAFNLLGVNSPETALMSCFDSLRYFILTGSGDSKKYIRYLPSSDELQILPQLGQIDHFIVIFSNGKTVEGIVQFFGGIGYLVRLADEYDGPDFCYGYQVNPLRDSNPAEVRNPLFDKFCIPTFDHGVEKLCPDVGRIYNEIISRLLERYYDLAQHKELSRIINEELMPHKGKLFTKEVAEKLVSRLTRFIVSRLNLDQLD